MIPDNIHTDTLGKRILCKRAVPDSDKYTVVHIGDDVPGGTVQVGDTIRVSRVSGTVGGYDIVYADNVILGGSI
jgi:hypothetical protein